MNAVAEGGGGGGGFQGIDPSQLSSLMQSMKSGVAAGQPLAGNYLGRFGQLGLDTSRISKLLADYTWAQSQQSMLQRRYTLASHQPSAQWVNGMATSGAGTLKYATSKQAQTAGGNAAKQFQDGKISGTQFLALLKQHEDDPDWQTGAMRTLGQSGLWQVAHEIPPSANGGENTADMTAVAMAVAAAMGNGVNFPIDDMSGTEDLSLLAPLLKYAKFPPQALASMGKNAMAPGQAMYAPQVWAALAASPQGSALFIQQNAPQIVEYIHAGDHGGGLPDDQSSAFLNVLKAGTINIKSTDPQLGGQAVTALIKAYDGDSGAHAPTQFDALYGQMVKTYWPDAMFALTSKASASDPHGLLTSPDGMKVGSGQWATFIDEAMRDPQTSAMLLSMAHTQGSTWMNLASQQGGSTQNSDSYNFDAGVVDGYFDYQAKQVYNQISQEDKDKANAWKDGVSEKLGDVVGMGVDIVADPGAAAATVTKTVSEAVVTDVLQKGLDAIPTDGSAPPAPQYSSWQGSWQDNARNWFNNSNASNLAGNQQRQALVNSAQGQPFLVNGKIPATSSMTAKQLAAYNTWLSSPAVGALLLDNGPQDAYLQGYNSTVTQATIAGGG